MAFVPFPPGTVEIHLNGDTNTVPIQNTLGAKFISGPAAASDGAALIAAIAAYFTSSSWFTHIDQNTGLDNIEVLDLTSASGWTASASSSEVGTVTTAPVQSQVALVMTLQTLKRGRSYRGRNYVPGLPAAALVNSGNWSSATLTLWETLYSGLLVTITTAGWTPVILSRIQNKVQLGLGVPTPISSIRANAKLGTIRGRLS